MDTSSGHFSFGQSYAGDACLMKSDDVEFSGVYGTVGAAYDDVELSATVLSAGSIKRDYGLYLRVPEWSPGDVRWNVDAGYRCTVFTGPSNTKPCKLRLQSLTNSRPTTVSASSTFFLTEDDWYTVEAYAIGASLGCAIRKADGTLLASTEGTDDTYASGHVGTWNAMDDFGSHYWKSFTVLPGADAESDIITAFSK